jgi:membrane-associated phospholipid phosphatase
MARKRVRHLLTLGGAAFFLGLFLHLTSQVWQDSETLEFDKAVLAWIAAFRRPLLNGVAVDITALGSATLLTLFSLVGLLILGLHRDWRGAKFLVLGALGAGLGTSVVKNFFGRVRPDPASRLIEAAGFSYPSGHSFGATSFYLILALLVCRHVYSTHGRIAIVTLALTLIGLVGFSRMYLGVHYPTDVASGFCLGAAWALCLAALFFKPGEAPLKPAPEQ